MYSSGFRRNSDGRRSEGGRSSYGSRPNRHRQDRYRGSGGHDPRRGGRGSFRGRGRNRNNTNNLDISTFIKKAIPPQEVAPHVPKYQFDELPLDRNLKRNIVDKGYVLPTPVQEQAIPEILKGKDLLGIANTGTGKTAAFLIPLIERIIQDRSNKVLIIVPTRELADQVNNEVYSLTRDLRVYSVQCIGGQNIQRQIYQIRKGFSFIIGTPGRLKDLTERGVLDLTQFKIVTLDEVDRMLDMGFINDIKELIGKLPEERQSLFFSATLDRKVEQIIDLLLKKDCVKVSVKSGETSSNVDQDVVHVTDRNDKLMKLKNLLSDGAFEKVLIFANTKREVDRIQQELKFAQIFAESIHGDKRQRERQRAIDQFKQGRSKVLIATDVAARGLDISDVTHVINYDIPQTYDDYVHRIGRTGRANKYGQALTFVEG